MLSIESVKLIEKSFPHLQARPIHRIANELANIVEDFDLLDEDVEFVTTSSADVFQLLINTPMLKIVTELEFRADGRLSSAISHLSVEFQILENEFLGLCGVSIMEIRDRLQEFSTLPERY